MKRRIPFWQIATFTLLLASLGCNLLQPIAPNIVPAATPRATAMPLPPTIVETVPPVGSVISPTSLFTIFFSEKMERASVENALSGDFPGGFIFAWVDDATLTLAPKSALPVNSKVTFALAAGAKSSSGLALNEPVSFSYQTPGQLAVTQTLPATGAADVSPDSAVVVTFNQPVVPLGAYSSSLPEGLTLEPAATGKGEWLNTSTYIFHADPALAGGVKYTARVNPQLVSTSGMGLDAASQNTSWSFSTALPQVSDIKPDVADGRLNLDATLEISFNQSMDRASVESGFGFTGPDGKVPGSFEWNKQSSVLTFKPTDLLKRETSYRLTIAAEAHSRGGAALGSDLQITYQSVPDFGVFSTSFPNGQTRPANESLEITFSAPLARYTDSELRAMLTINPKVSDYYPYVNGAVLSLGGGFKPGQAYTITFSSGLKDRWEQSLAEDYHFNFTEPDARPSLSMGGYLPVLFTRPDDPNVSVQAVNVNTVAFSSGSMTLDDFLHTQSDLNFQNSYTPADRRSWSIRPNLPRNDNQPVTIRLSDSPLATGFYFLTADSPDVDNNGTNRHVLVVSDLNVTLKLSPSEALLWAVDLRTQTPANGIKITLYDDKFANLASGATDERGLWRGKVSNPRDGSSVYAILGQPGDDQFGMAASSWNMGISPWDYGLRFDTSGPREQVYLYTERPVYRPGDVVHYRGILKNWYDGRYDPLPQGAKDFSVSLFGPYGKISQPQTVSLSAFGGFNGEFNLPANAEPGYYNLSVAQGGVDVQNGVLGFQVADYRKPEINLAVSISPDPARSGQPLVGTVKAEYFFGAAAADLPFTWRLYTSPSYFSIPDYNTGVQTGRWLSAGGSPFGVMNREGQGRTTADGSFSIPLNDLNVDDTSIVTLEVSATESGGFPVSARATATLHPDNFYIGVRPAAWVGQAGSPLGFDLLSVDWDRQPVSQPLTVAFEKVRWDRTDGLYGDFTFTPVFTPVESKSIKTSPDGKASTSFTPPDAGTYVLDITSGKAHTQSLLWVTGSENAAWPNLPYQQIQLTANKEKYKPGEQAEVFIPNPFNAPVQALLTTERSTFKSVDVITIPAEGYKFKLSLTDDSAPNIYISATLLGREGVDFRQGYVNLPVEPSAFTLNVDLKATPDKAKPGDTITLDLTVTDSQGQPMQAEFSMAVVDLAALALADPNSADIVPAYYDIQPLGVRTSLTAAIYTRRLLNFGGGRGGGGGGEVLTLRSKFPDTAYWKADILTDPQGKAHLSFTLPDNLTTWQVDSRGLTSDTKVGQARVRVVTSKEVLIRPQTPRFLVVGDHAQLAAMVNNTTNQPLEATVSLQAPGLTLDNPSLAEQKVSLPANGRARVTWTGLVENGETVDAVFTARAGGFEDATRPTDGPIPVMRYSAPQTFSTAGFLTGASSREEIIAVPRSFQPLGGNLQVELSPSLAAAILGSLKALESSEQPWSSEQIVSTFLPNLATYKALKDSGIDNPELTTRLQTSLAGDLHHLVNFRRDDGGWAWTTSSQETDPYLSAYILFGLQKALESGLNVEGIDLNGTIQSGRDYLFANGEPFRAKPDLTLAWQANRAAFYAYILTQTGGLGGFNSLADQLYDQRTHLDPWARAMLAQALFKLSSTDERVTTLLSDLESTAIRSATGAHWESAGGEWMNPGTPLFTTAVVLDALAERNPASLVAADAVHYLASQRTPDGGWDSGYESAWVLIALNKYMQASGELRGDFSFSATLNGTALAQGKASGPENMTLVTATAPLTQLNLEGANSLLINRQDGTGKLYYRAALSVDRPVETAPALERGMAISREYMDCSNDPCQPVSSYKMKADESGRVTVRLTITLPNAAYYLMVQDYIPAGADILDSSLKTSQQGEQDQSVQAKYDPSDPFGEGWGWWFFNRPQIYSNHILWSADYLPAGTYQLTYTLVPSLAGEYRVLPARTWQAYFPEVQGASAGSVFAIIP
ncbi:MAG TPA: Ig-like domain-containing protein [Anaerolineales bacterium]|jgi:hypothetical protein